MPIVVKRPPLPGERPADRPLGQLLGNITPVHHGSAQFSPGRGRSALSGAYGLTSSRASRAVSAACVSERRGTAASDAADKTPERCAHSTMAARHNGAERSQCDSARRENSAPLCESQRSRRHGNLSLVAQQRRAARPAYFAHEYGGQRAGKDRRGSGRAQPAGGQRSPRCRHSEDSGVNTDALQHREHPHLPVPRRPTALTVPLLSRGQGPRSWSRRVGRAGDGQQEALVWRGPGSCQSRTATVPGDRRAVRRTWQRNATVPALLHWGRDAAGVEHLDETLERPQLRTQCRLVPAHVRMETGRGGAPLLFSTIRLPTPQPARQVAFPEHHKPALAGRKLAVHSDSPSLLLG
ncbi:hypothetical protein AAFF_G00423930 [Aldrovandia affinis]|uniref:Uncharacterized protein n=1 Tax=Aldrovandia affinis TaxID=143900 RepID=A0AAD7T7S5_9TELE|nr:hypothetical protein AAFF_G00423930 [Aldrovandia affinis]